MNPQQSQANAFIRTAQELQTQNRYEEAIAAYEKAIDLFPIYRSYKFLIGDLYFRLQNYTAAAQAYWAVLEDTPEHAQAWSSLGQCLLLLKQVSKAVEAFDHAVEIDEQLVEAWYYGALAYSYLDQPQETKKRLQRALQLRPDWEPLARQEPLLKTYLTPI
jgi:tetratricopeptide (TPR) repeat protein